MQQAPLRHSTCSVGQFQMFNITCYSIMRTIIITLMPKNARGHIEIVSCILLQMLQKFLLLDETTVLVLEYVIYYERFQKHISQLGNMFT